MEVHQVGIPMAKVDVRQKWASPVEWTTSQKVKVSFEKISSLWVLRLQVPFKHFFFKLLSTFLFSRLPSSLSP